MWENSALLSRTVRERHNRSGLILLYNRYHQQLIAQHVVVGLNLLQLHQEHALWLRIQRTHHTPPSLIRLRPLAQEERYELVVRVDKASVGVCHARLPRRIEGPRAVFFVAAVLHEGRERSHLKPAHEQLLRPTQRALTRAIPADIRAEVGIVDPGGVEHVFQGILQPVKRRVLIAHPATEHDVTRTEFIVHEEIGSDDGIAVHRPRHDEAVVAVDGSRVVEGFAVVLVGVLAVADRTWRNPRADQFNVR